MKLFHATDKKNLAGIKRVGLLAAMATGKRSAVWAVSRDMIDNAILHCCNKRGVKPADVVILELTVPSRWVKRFSVSGMVYLAVDIDPKRIRVYAHVSLVMGE